MSDALPLPPRPDLNQYKQLARDLKKACQSEEPNAIRDWAERWADSLAHLIAHLKGDVPTADIRRGIQSRWHRFRESHPRSSRCLLADAHFFLARLHGFESWPKFAAHLEAAAGAASPISQFEAAADAIASGDSGRLAQLLAGNPDLARRRSTREHRSTLLHYVSANGIEDYRQRTPSNIVEIAAMLLDAGSDVNAESDAYGGRSTTLGLTATSVHPEKAGVQVPLMELLLARGAIIDLPGVRSAVNACLHNGQGHAAEFLAERGASLDLEGAAGVGRLDLVKSYFREDGSPGPGVTPQLLKDSFAWACEYGRTGVVEFLLERGVPLDAQLRHNGQTGLHWAAHGGHPTAVKMLLDRGARVDAIDETYHGTPMDWAHHGSLNAPPERREQYYAVVALLARAGGKLDPETRNFPTDPRMLAALKGEG